MWCTGVLVLPVTLCGAARHCVQYYVIKQIVQVAHSVYNAIRIKCEGSTTHWCKSFAKACAVDINFLCQLQQAPWAKFGDIGSHTKGSGGTAHTCSGRHSQYSCELLAQGFQELHGIAA